MEEKLAIEWDESEYIQCLARERYLFAWTLTKFAVVKDEAESLALSRYPFESSDDKFRGLIFHDHAWHWAMLHLRGQQYWVDDRGSEIPSREYREEEQRFLATQTDFGIDE